MVKNKSLPGLLLGLVKLSLNLSPSVRSCPNSRAKSHDTSCWRRVAIAVNAEKVANSQFSTLANVEIRLTLSYSCVLIAIGLAFVVLHT